MTDTTNAPETNAAAAFTPMPERDDVAWIRDELLPGLVADGKLAPISDVHVEPLSLSESFMLTVCYRIRVTLADDSVQKMIVKITPNVDAGTLKSVLFEELFHNEITAYGTIFPELGWTDHYPKFYYSHNRPDGAAILLGDFSVQNWRVPRAKFNLSLEHILVAVKELGKFHGTMYALKANEPKTFRGILAGLRESRFTNPTVVEQWDRRLRIGPKRAAAAARAAEGNRVPEAFLQRLESALDDTYAYMKRIALRTEEPLAVICHGDFLRNNIAFRYADETDSQPEAALMFDFQTLRYASPMLDLVTFNVNSTGVDVRQPNFDRIFAAYHEALVENYAKRTGTVVGSDALPAHLGAESLLREYARYLPFGLTIGASFLPMLHEPDLTPFSEYPSRTDEFERQDAWNRGGKGLDRELAAIVTEIYELSERFGLELL